MTMTKLMLATLCCLVLVPSQCEALSVEELKAQYENDLADLRAIVRVQQAIIEKRLDNLEQKCNTEANIIVQLNDTSELEARVTVLEEDVTALTDEVDDIESVNILQEQRLNIVETDISDNENDIEELVDITTGLTGQVLALEQRVEDLESGGGNANVTELTERVETLEEVTSQLTDDVSSLEDNDVTQDERISGIEEDVTSLDQRVEDLESSGGGNITDYGDTAFLAALSTTESSTANPVIFDWEVINPGGHYNPETGEYTVPYDGIYQFSVQLQADSSSSTVYFHIMVDGSVNGSHRDAWNLDQYRSTTVLLELQAGQTVEIYRGGGSYGHGTYFYSYFCGHMISAN